MAGDPTQQNVVLTADTTQYQQSMDQSASKTQVLLTSVMALSNALGELTKRAGQKIELVGAGTAAALAAATYQAANFEQQMSQLRAQSEMTGRSFDTMVRQTNNLRASVGMSTGEIVNLVQQLNNMGQGNYNVERLATAFIKLGAVTGESVSGLADGLISLQRAMGTTGAEQTERYASALANLSANAGTSAEGILSFSNAIAPIGRVAGMTQNQIMGVATAFNKVGADGYGATTAFNKMLTDITRAVQYGSPEIAAYANLIGKSTEEFTKMSKSDAIGQIFTQINSQGPAAMKTLERLGLDGPRTLKSIQAVAAGGGIQQSVDQATAGYNDTGKFDEAAKKGMDTLNEAAQRLKNTLAQMGEAFGSGLVEPVTQALKAITMILSPINQLLQMLGSLPGIAGAAGAALMGLTGFGIANLGKMMGLAGISQFAQGFVRRGFGAGRAMGNEDRMNTRTRNAWRSYQAGDGSRAQRAGYTAGAKLGSAWSVSRAMASQGGSRGGARMPVLPVPGSTVPFAGLNRSAATAAGLLSPVPVEGGGAGIRGIRDWTWRTPFNAVVRGAGNMVGSTLDTLRPGVRQNVFARQPVLGGAGSSLKPMDYQNIQAKEGINSASAGFKKAATAAEEHARQLRNTSGVLKTATNEMANVAQYAAKGYAGLARTGAGLAWQGAKQVGSALGGPTLAIMGGMMLADAISTKNQQQKADLEEISNAGPLDAAGGAYRAALGEAAKATSTFADVVKQNAAHMIPNAGADFNGQVDDAMMRRYNQNINAPYTDQKVATMTDAQMKNWAQSGEMSPADLELFGYDVLRRTGGDQKRTQDILNAAKSKSPVDMNNLFSGLSGRDMMGMGGFTSASKAAASGAEATLGQMAGAAGSRDPQGGNRVMVAAFNAAMEKTKDPEENLPQIATVINKQLNGDDKSLAAISDLLRASNTSINGMAPTGIQGTWEALYKRVQSGQATTQEKSLYGMFQNSGLTGTDRWSTSVSMPVRANSDHLFSQLDDTVVTNARNVSAFGSYAFKDNATGRAIDLAANNTGNTDIVGQKADELAQSATRFTGSLSGGIDEMQKFKAAAKNASDPLYQLANSAESLLRAQQQLAMHYNTQVQNVQLLEKQATLSSLNAQLHPSEGAQAEAQSDKMAFDQAKAGAYDRVMSIALQAHQMNQQQGYARSDLTLQETRSDAAKKQGDQWNLDAYNLSRSRAQTAFDLQRKQSQDDYDLQRKQSDDAYYRQLSRTHRDFDLQRKYSVADFNKNRVRAEADFQHQVVEMTKSTAKSVYDIYSRVNVQRTWDSQNLLQNMADQQKRLDEQQANLKKLRGMGLSGDAIDQMGLNDPKNAQQLSRMVDDFMSDPSLVKKFNDSVASRIKSAGQVVTDQDNEQWKEMNRSFKQNQSRSLTDFNQSLARQDKQFKQQLDDQASERKISIQQQDLAFRTQMSRSATAFNLQMSQQATDFDTNLRHQNALYNTARTQMETDFATQITRANKAFQEAATDMNSKIGGLTKEAMKTLTGTAKSEFGTLLSYLDGAQVDLSTKLTSMTTQIATAASTIGNAIYGSSPAPATKGDATGDIGHGSASSRNNTPNSGGGDVQPVTSGSYPITSAFGPRRGGFHYGVDLGTPVGTGVHTSMAGRVVMTGFQGNGYGNHVRVQHSNGLFSIYGHLSRYNVATGQSLQAGQGIGSSGATGNVTGPHLHYQIQKGSAYGNQNAINPMPWLRRSAGGGVYGTQLGDRVPMLAEAGEYVMPKHRVKDMGWAFMDALRANGVAGVKNYLLAGNSVPNTTATHNYYQRIDKGNHFTGDITVQAQDPMEFARKMEAQQRMKALTGARR